MTLAMTKYLNIDIRIFCQLALYIHASSADSMNRRVAEIQIFEKTYLIVIKDETSLKFKINVSILFPIGSYAQKLVASY